GINDLRLWKMQDKTLQFRDLNLLADWVLDVIKEVHPEIIYTFYPGYGVHPDHDTLSAATVHAVSHLDAGSRPEIRGHAFGGKGWKSFRKPDIEIDVSDVIDKKMDAVRAHSSQSELITKKMDELIKENPEKKEEILDRFIRERYWL